MKGFVSVVTARLGKFFYFRWLFRWPESSGALPLRVIAGGLFSILCWTVSHFESRLRHAVPPLLAELGAVLPGKGESERICAPFGGKQSVHLKDGSSVELDSGACIVPEFSRTRRVIILESGEAIFQAARDPLRPFVVETGPIAVRALGTEFDVYRKELTTRVSVIDGSVQVSSRGPVSSINTEPLTKLQQMDVPDDAAQTRRRRNITEADVKRITAWVDGFIDLEHQTPAQAFEELQRYQHIHVEFKDPENCGGIPLGGQIRTSGLDTILGMLEVMHVQSEYDRAKQWITVTCGHGKAH